MEDNSNKQIVATDRTFKYDDAGKLIFAVETYYDYTVENRLEAVYEGDELLMAAAYDGDGNRVFQLNYNLHTDEDWKANSGNGNGNNKDNSGNSSSNNGKAKKNNNGNSTNAEETASQNQSGILFPVSEEVSATEQSLIDKIKTTGKQKNYELIEYINDVNREYVEVLVEQNINGATDTSYVYGVDRLSLNRFDGSAGYYLYDGRGSVAGLTNEEGQIYQSYRYSVNGEITFGAPQYENEYTYNGESYNPNIESQYLRARYYNVVTATFLTEDSYLGEITNPLTLNRYNYTLSNYLNYQDPSGHTIETIIDFASLIWSVVEFAKEPSVFNGLMIAWDFTAFIVPVLPGSWVKRVVGGAGDALGLSRLGRQAVRVASSGDEVGCALLKFGDEGLPAIKKAGNEVVQETTEKGAKETGEEVFEETLKEQSDEIGENYEKIFDEQREPNPQAEDYYDELADHATGVNRYNKYLEQLDGFSENKINHIINGSTGSNHGWENLVPDKNWDDIKNIIAEVMENGAEGPYKSVFSKKTIINGFEVEVTYAKLSDGTIKISDAWINQ